MNRNRFLTGSLASIAVASAITLTAPAANAADERGCGQPAVDAVYSTVVHDPVFRTVPAQTHTEWQWQRDVDDLSYEFTKLISPASVETDWTRHLPGPTEYQFVRKIVDVPGTPAIPATPEVGHFETVVIKPAVQVVQWDYVQRVTGKHRWESENWGAEHGEGWSKTGETKTVVLVPAVTKQVWVIDVPARPEVPAVEAITHKEYLWATSNPGGDWVGPIDERVGEGSDQTLTTDGKAPEGDGWTLVTTRNIDAVYDTIWAETAPNGYEPTGASKVVGSHHEQTDATSSSAPDGDGWSEVADSATTVVDVPETQELVTEGYTEQVLLSPAIPATAPCVDPPAEQPTDEPASEPADEPSAATDGPQAAPAAQVSTPATVLPETGNDVPPWMAPTGILAMLAGIAVIRSSRRAGVR